NRAALPSALVGHGPMDSWPKPPVNELLRDSAGLGRVSVSSYLIEPAQLAPRPEQRVHGQRGFDERPALVSIRRLAAQEQEGPGRDQRHELVVFQGKARLLHGAAQIPNGLPVAETNANAAFAEHRDLEPLVKGRCVENFLGPE